MMKSFKTARAEHYTENRDLCTCVGHSPRGDLKPCVHDLAQCAEQVAG